MIINKIQDSDLQSFNVVSEIIVDKNVIGEFIKDTANLVVFNENHKYDNLDKTYIDIKNFGEWFVEDIENDEENESLTLKLCDKSKKFDEDYEDTFPFPASMKAWATWIGEKVGIPLKGNFLNENLILTEKPYMGNNPKWRNAVKIISKYASSWADINNDGTYSIKWFEDKTYQIDDWETFKHGLTTKPTNVLILSTGVTEDNVRWPETIPEDPHELRIEDDWTNINRYEINEAIYNQVNGFFYTPISNLTLLYGIFELLPGQKIKTKDIELNDIETYISSHTLNWDGGTWEDPESWTSTLKMLDLKETTTKYQYSNSIENRLGRTEIICDKNNKQIEMIIEDVDDNKEDITELKLETGRLAEQVSHVATISIESAGTGIQRLIGLNTNKLVYLEIHPTNHDIDTQYLSDYILLGEEIQLDQPVLSIVGKKIYNIVLPNLYYLNDVYDTFIQDNVKEKTYVIHRIGFDLNGNKYVLENELIEKIEMNSIILEEGDYQFFIDGIFDAYINVRGVLKNDYTSLFATQLQLRALQELTANSINMSVEEFLDGEKLTGASLILAINNDISETKLNSDKIELTANDVLNIIASNYINLKTHQIGITSDNFILTPTGYLWCKQGDFEGKITSSSGDIGGWIIEKNALYKDVTIGNYDYRVYIQSPLQSSGEGTWILSCQRKPKGTTGGYYGTFHVDLNGDLHCSNIYLTSEAENMRIYAALELYAGIPYIDFHWNAEEGDYTARIIEDQPGHFQFRKPGGYANCQGGSWTNSSSKLVKKNIKEISEKEAKALLNIKAVSFDYKNGIDKNQRGFIAEDVMKVMEDYVFIPKDYDESKFDNTEDENGNVDITQDVPSLDYSKFVVPLVKLCQMQQKQIDNMQKEINELKELMKNGIQ